MEGEEPPSSRRKLDDDDPSPQSISVEDLRRTLEQKKETRTVGRYLTTVDPRSDEFIVSYDNNGLVKTKVFGTPLHYACRDEDGLRGEEKIRIILDAADRARVDRRLLLTVREIVFKADRVYMAVRSQWVHRPPSFKCSKDASTTPLWILVQNDSSTVGALKAICKHWPGVVFLWAFSMSVLTNLCYSFRDQESEECFERIYAMMEVVLDAADNANGGSRALLQTFDGDEGGQLMLGCYNAPADLEGYTEVQRGTFDEEKIDLLTPIHSVCDSTLYDTNYGPCVDKVLALFLERWPDAFLYCRDAYHLEYEFPFRTLFPPYLCNWKSGNHMELDHMKILAAILKHSSLKGLAFVLLQASEGTSVSAPGFYLVRTVLRFDGLCSAELAIQRQIDGILKERLQNPDSSRRTLLHHIAALCIDANMGWGRFDEDDPSEEEEETMIREVKLQEEANKNYINEAFYWLCSISRDISSNFDIDGNNPFQYALAAGKTWDRGIESLLSVNPNWPSIRDGTGLYPFMTASLADDFDLTTVYELLRSAPQVLATLRE